MENIDAKALLVGVKVNYLKNIEMMEALDMAIKALEKQIPQKPKIESWSPALCPALCPACEAELSESIGDGYYKHYYNLNICECGQKLKWD